MTLQSDVCIIGAGILGLATARALLERAPRLRVVTLEKEPKIASHQTGHNSGVIHQGIYYKPGSLKAQLCVSGARRMVEYCQQKDIPFQRVGKVIVATDPLELPRLDLLYERALANGVPGIVKIGRDELNEIEPHAAGLAAIYSPQTAIVAYTRVADAIRADVESHGGIIQTNAPATAIHSLADEIIVNTPNQEFHARYLVNCGGLYADLIARRAGLNPNVRIIPFRGEYYMLKPTGSELVRGLIYPVTDPQLPFLGVHFTRRIDGSVEAGPNAVFALGREGYGWTRIHPIETAETLVSTNFWRMAQLWWRTGVFEFYRSLSKSAFVKSLQKLVPEITSSDLERGGAGVRAQAVNERGELLDDFCIVESERALHVLNAPSPAATASLAIGSYLAERAQSVLQSF
ncbi:MAG TPA: L-2-hydroxyglutarate oxidase [Anaerolineae bacterium]|nr:L-2-hydroxyglutarate oxidase [Anaerolineae bacterium]